MQDESKVRYPVGEFLSSLSNLVSSLRSIDQGNDPVNIALVALRGGRSFTPSSLEAEHADDYIDAMTNAGLCARRVGPDVESDGERFADVQVTW